MEDTGDSYERNKDRGSCRGYKSAGWLHISRGSFPVGKRDLTGMLWNGGGNSGRFCDLLRMWMKSRDRKK